MKYKITDIGPEGLEVRRDLADSQVRALLASSGVELGPGPARMQLELHLGHAEAAASVILVRGSLQAHFEVGCARCLGPAPIDAGEPDLRLTFLPEGPRVAEQELSADDLDTYSYDGEEIDLEPVLRELLILAIPMAPVCSEACRGICGGCGADLNREPCRCTAGEALASPWVAELNRLKKSIS